MWTKKTPGRMARASRHNIGVKTKVRNIKQRTDGLDNVRVSSMHAAPVCKISLRRSVCPRAVSQWFGISTLFHHFLHRRHCLTAPRNAQAPFLLRAPRSRFKGSGFRLHRFAATPLCAFTFYWFGLSFGLLVRVWVLFCLRRARYLSCLCILFVLAAFQDVVLRVRVFSCTRYLILVLALWFFTTCASSNGSFLQNRLLPHRSLRWRFMVGLTQRTAKQQRRGRVRTGYRRVRALSRSASLPSSIVLVQSAPFILAHYGQA